MIALVDYGVGNLFSLRSSFYSIGEDVVVSSDTDVLKSADKIILPGVGAFQDAYTKLNETGLDKLLEELKNNGTPIMGICLGMQLLFERSYEYGISDGLGFIKGEVTPISDRIDNSLKIPHMGWNALKFCNPKHEIFKYINNGDHVYFVHSYSATGCDESVIATCEYSADLTAAVALDNVIGCQFHPEKSGEVGLKILKAFCEM